MALLLSAVLRDADVLLSCSQGEAVGVVGGEPALYVMDIQLEESVRRKGLGRHLMRTLEMVARKQVCLRLLPSSASSLHSSSSLSSPHPIA